MAEAGCASDQATQQRGNVIQRVSQARTVRSPRGQHGGRLVRGPISPPSAFGSGRAFRRAGWADQAAQQN